jgi:phosphatidate cytidylyltransferase
VTNLTTRVITAIVMVAVLLAALFVLPDLVATYLFAMVFLVAAWEWSGLIKGAVIGLRLIFVALLAGAAFVPLLLSVSREVAPLCVYAGIVCWLAFTLTLIFNLQISGAVRGVLLGLLTLLPAWFSVVFLLGEPAGAYYFLWCVGIVAAADIGAYFIGRRFGSRKLAPSISPGKTLEGFFGGLVAASLFTSLVALTIGLNGIYFLLAGCLLAAISVIGDLWISRFKRAAGIKDSGHILPGHGGILDRIDSLLAALPLFVIVSGQMEGFVL